MDSMNDPLIKAIKNLDDRSKTIEVIKKGVAERCDILEETVSLDDCVSVLMNLIYNIMMTAGNPRQMFIDLYEGIAPFNTFRVGYFHDKMPMSMQSGKMPPYNVFRAIIYKCASIIWNSKIEHLDAALDLE